MGEVKTDLSSTKYFPEGLGMKKFQISKVIGRSDELHLVHRMFDPYPNFPVGSECVFKGSKTLCENYVRDIVYKSFLFADTLGFKTYKEHISWVAREFDMTVGEIVNLVNNAIEEHNDIDNYEAERLEEEAIARQADGGVY